jgi:hypothetical protein
VFDVCRVRPELGDQLVVVVMGVRTERFVALEDDHRVAVGVELLEGGADTLHRDEGRRIVRVHRDGVGLAHLLEGGDEDVGDHGERQPTEDDGHGEHPDGVRDLRSLPDIGAHRSPGTMHITPRSGVTPARDVVTLECSLGYI